MRFDATQFHVGTESGTLIAEASTLGIRSPDTTIEVVGYPREGVTTVFRYVTTDQRDGEIQGWRFRHGEQSLLIIND